MSQHSFETIWLLFVSFRNSQATCDCQILPVQTALQTRLYSVCCVLKHSLWMCAPKDNIFYKICMYHLRISTFVVHMPSLVFQPVSPWILRWLVQNYYIGRCHSCHKLEKSLIIPPALTWVRNVEAASWHESWLQVWSGNCGCLADG